ncbi:hypothetical protein FRB99_002299 [Tulasnella sp. 403]|nr:hypothetical protein FRB99_002299 [Tulasnella sp. 403]
MICTGVGRQGREVELPGYERQRSLAILMGVARIAQIVAALTESEKEGTGRRKGRPYPLSTPIAVIERASCPDQRAVMSTLENIEEALARCGEQRPPGMMLVGWAALALTGSGDLTVLNDAIEHGQNMEVLTKMDAARVNKWFGGEKSMVVDGLPTMWDLF